MNKRLALLAHMALCVSALTFAQPCSSALAADDNSQVFVCTNVAHAKKGAAAFKSLFQLDGSALETTIALKKKKQCWFEAVNIPKKHTTLSRLYIEEGSADAYVVVPLQLSGVMRYVVYFEEGGPVVDA